MAVAPLNKFLTIAVPVAPGEQTVYTTPTGVSSIGSSTSLIPSRSLHIHV